MSPPPPFRKHLRGLVAGLLVLGVAALGLAGVMRYAARMLLQADAEHGALQWAAFARNTVPDLQQALEGRGFTLEALRQLRRLRGAGDIFRFRLYDREGRLVLVSDDLDLPAPADPGMPPWIAHRDEPVDAEVGRVLRLGDNQVQMRHGDGAKLPALFSDAVVPVLGDGRVLGGVQVCVDQTAREERIEAAFRVIALAVAVLLLGVVGMTAWQRRVRERRERQARAQVQYLAHHDQLTGAVNRAHFQEELQRAAWRAGEGGPAFAVLCVDLDGFKDINDALGHTAGDQLLQQAAQRLHHAAGEGDVVARLGADEFAVLQAVVHQAADVQQLGERLVTALAQPYLIAGQSVHGPASAGAAMHGTDGLDGAELLHKAEQALYRAKAHHRGGFSFYDAAMDERLQARRAIARDLRQALYAGELHLNFQPLYERDGKTLEGYEALVRWTHPQRGPIPPSEFIPVAEESGLIEDLGLWVLAHACDEAARWPASLSVSVNLSAAQFKHAEKLVEDVRRCLDSSGLDASRLELEITESLLMSNTEQVVQTLHAFTDMGVRIAMDDFGTGYSSLAYLWRFPFDKVKIDRAFTHHLDQDPKVELIVRSIVSLAHSLNIRVNAEGVETPAQLQRLQQHGCDELQGFLLGRPTPPTQLRHEGARPVADHKLPRARTDFASGTVWPSTVQ